MGESLIWGVFGDVELIRYSKRGADWLHARLQSGIKTVILKKYISKHCDSGMRQ